MKWLMFLAASIAVSMLQGCATSPRSEAIGASSAGSSASDSCSTGSGCAAVAKPVARFTEVPVESNAPFLEGHPLTSVVVTQCNLVVAVYATMPDGRLLRFDATSTIPAEQLVSMAYTATRSERVEVSCDKMGVVGYEEHTAL